MGRRTALGAYAVPTSGRRHVYSITGTRPPDIRRSTLEDIVQHASQAGRIHIDRMLIELGDSDDAAPGPMCNGITRLEVRTLGPLRVIGDGREIPSGDWYGRRKARLLLVRLALEGGAPVDREGLAEELWTDFSSGTLTSRLSPLVAAIRNALQLSETTTRTLETTASGNAFLLRLSSSDFVDVITFREKARHCRATTSGPDVQKLGDAAIQLYDGDFLAGEDRTVWVENTRVRLREELAATILHMLSCDAPPTDCGRVVQLLESALADDDTHEAVCLALVRLHALAGNTKAASNAFHRTRKALGQQLGLSPGPELVQAHDELLELGRP